MNDVNDVKRYVFTGTDYALFYNNEVVPADEHPARLVDAADYDQLAAHNAELRRALEDHLARFIGLDKALDDAARAALSAGRSGE